MTSYRDDRKVLEERIGALEQELSDFGERIARARREIGDEGAREAELARRIELRETRPDGRTRFDRVLETIVFVPLASAILGAVAVALGVFVIGVPTMIVTDHPGDWMMYALGVVLALGMIGGAWASSRAIWRSD